MTGCILVVSAAPDRATAERIADALVEEGLAAAVHIREVASRYRWKGAVERTAEHVLDIYTVEARFEAVRARIAALHPYEMPGVLALPITAAAPDYLRWIATAGEWPE